MLNFPASKINIGLNIIGKRDDGFHNLESLFYPVELTDILEIIPAVENRFMITGNKPQGNPENNLVLKARDLIQEEYHVGHVNIHLHKIVPDGAGLGGGSANASATLKLMNEIFELGISNKKLEDYALSLGSDCPFFIREKPAFVTGRGEQLREVDAKLSGYGIKIVKTELHVSTAEAFSKIKPKSNDIDLIEVYHQPVEQWKKQIVNDFEAVLTKDYPILERLKNSLYDEGALFASMTGSGSAVYGIFDKKPKKTGLAQFEWVCVLA